MGFPEVEDGNRLEVEPVLPMAMGDLLLGLAWHSAISHELCDTVLPVSLRDQTNGDGGGAVKRLGVKRKRTAERFHVGYHSLRSSPYH